MIEEQQQINYHTYIRSQGWYKRRYGALQRAENRCQVCNSAEHLQVHHRDYSRLGAEKPSDLTVLCKTCHELFSRYGRLVPPPQEVIP
jgi:5-methylcytosine-specific restriction endonuclease McrA